MLTRFLDKIKNKLTAHLFCAVNPDDVIKHEKGLLFIGDELITPTELANFKSEIAAMNNFRVWQIVKETLRFRAMEVGFKKSMNFDDVKSMKTMLVNLDTIESIFKLIEKQK